MSNETIRKLKEAGDLVGLASFMVMLQLPVILVVIMINKEILQGVAFNVALLLAAAYAFHVGLGTCSPTMGC